MLKLFKKTYQCTVYRRKVLYMFCTHNSEIGNVFSSCLKVILLLSEHAESQRENFKVVVWQMGKNRFL